MEHDLRLTTARKLRWDKNAWPVVNGDGTVSYNMQAASLPAPIMQKTLAQKDDFNEDGLGFEWNYLNNPIDSNYSLSSRKGYLRLIGNDSNLSQLPGVTFIGRRQQHFDFITTTSVDFVPKNNTEEAGITLYKEPAYHYDLAIKNFNKKRVLTLSYNIGLIHHIEKEIPLKDGRVQLRISGTQEYYWFSFSQDGNSYTTIGEADTRFLSSVTAGGFTGVYIALYATGNGKRSRANADFDWYTYEPQ